MSSKLCNEVSFFYAWIAIPMIPVVGLIVTL